MCECVVLKQVCCASDLCLLEALWGAGVGVEVAGVEAWRAALVNLTYLASSQHLLVGRLTWLIQSLPQVRQVCHVCKA